jgi:ribosomal protein S27E
MSAALNRARAMTDPVPRPVGEWMDHECECAEPVVRRAHDSAELDCVTCGGVVLNPAAEGEDDKSVHK